MAIQTLVTIGALSAGAYCIFQNCMNGNRQATTTRAATAAQRGIQSSSSGSPQQILAQHGINPARIFGDPQHTINILQSLPKLQAQKLLGALQTVNDEKAGRDGDQNRYFGQRILAQFQRAVYQAGGAGAAATAVAVSPQQILAQHGIHPARIYDNPQHIMNILQSLPQADAQEVLQALIAVNDEQARMAGDQNRYFGRTILTQFQQAASGSRLAPPHAAGAGAYPAPAASKKPIITIPTLHCMIGMGKLQSSVLPYLAELDPQTANGEVDKLVQRDQQSAHPVIDQSILQSLRNAADQIPQ